MKFLRSFFVVQVLLSFIFLNYSQLLYAAAGGAEYDSYSERVTIIKHAQLLGQLSAWADHNPEYRGPKVPGSPKETMKPDEIYSSMLRQLVYEGGIMADDMAVIFSNMRLEAEKGYGKSRELAEVLIKERGVESLVPSFSRQAERLQGLVLRTSLLNPPPTEGHSSRLLERARVVLEPLMEEHQRLYETAERVATEGIDAIKNDPDLGQFYGMPKLWDGNTVMMMPVVAWAAHHIARAYEDMFTGLHYVMAGKRSAVDFLSSGKGMITCHVTTSFPEFKEGNTAIDDFLALLHQLVKIDNEMLMAKTMGTPTFVTVSERQVSYYERYRYGGHEAFPLPDYAPLAAASKPKKTPRKPRKKKGKKKSGAGGVAAPAEYAEHKVMRWLKQLELDFIEETDRLLAVARTALDEEAGGAPRSALTAEERAEVTALRERVEAEEESLADEAAAMEEAEMQRVAAAEALLEKQRIAEERRQQREEQKRKDAEEAEARAEERRAATEERKALDKLEAEEKAAEIKAQRQEEESRRQAEEEARELVELEEQRRIAELNSIAARQRIEIKQRRTEEYRSQLAAAEARHEGHTAAAAKAEEDTTLTEGLDKAQDRDLFSAIFALTPVDYDTVLALLSGLRGIEIEGIDSQKPKIFFDLSDGRKKMLLFHKPHHDGSSLHRRSQNALRWRLEEMGYTKEHFGIE